MAYFDVKNYVTVAERLKSASDQIISIVSDSPMMLTDVVGTIRVTVIMKDGRSASGTSTFRLDLNDKSAQATSPVESAETASIGRALQILGFSSVRRPVGNGYLSHSSVRR